MYHGWAYRNDGALGGVPGEEAYKGDFDKSDLGLRKPAASKPIAISGS
jgi:phenylpropionate dioxygenase-like ring-hydroxylating dioxygenase large terminal subunit